MLRPVVECSGQEDSVLGLQLVMTLSVVCRTAMLRVLFWAQKIDKLAESEWSGYGSEPLSSD